MLDAGSWSMRTEIEIGWGELATFTMLETFERSRLEFTGLVRIQLGLKIIGFLPLVLCLIASGFDDGLHLAYCPLEF